MTLRTIFHMPTWLLRYLAGLMLRGNHIIYWWWFGANVTVCGYINRKNIKALIEKQNEVFMQGECWEVDWNEDDVEKPF